MKPSPDLTASPRFNRLETAIMAALAHDLRRTIPDLARQFQVARPGRRRNTAFGAWVEMVVDRTRPVPPQGLRGRFGTVHAMIEDLDEAVAFQVELYQGQILALHADTYGQDTRDIDFASVAFTEIFTLDSTGRSIPFASEPLTLERPPQTAPRPAAPRTVSAPAPTQYINPTPPGQVQNTPREVQSPEPLEASETEGHTTLLFGLWAAIGTVALFAIIAFNTPFAFAIIAAVFLGRAVKNPKALTAIAALIKKGQDQQALGR